MVKVGRGKATGSYGHVHQQHLNQMPQLPVSDAMEEYKKKKEKVSARKVIMIYHRIDFSDRPPVMLSYFHLP